MTLPPTPVAMELRYWRRIRRVTVEPLNLLLNKLLVPELKAGATVYGLGQFADADGFSLAAVLHQVWRDFDAGEWRDADGTATKMAEDVEKEARRWSMLYHGRMIRQLGLDPTKGDLQLSMARNAFVQDNVSLIKSIPRQYLERVERQVKEAVTAGMRHEGLAKLIEAEHGIAERRAKLIARDQISKHMGAMNQTRQTACGIEGYTWATAQDERVRPTHRANEGQSFSWSQQPATGHPGFDYQCRCIAIPDLRRR